MAKLGRTAKYAEWLEDDGLLFIKGLARQGLSNKQIAQSIGIAESTFREWQIKFPEFAAAIKKGRAPVVVSVEDAFYSRCEWHKVEEVTEEYEIDDDGNRIGKTRIRKTSRYVAPSDAILIFAIKNLHPGKFKDHPVAPAVEAVEDDGFIQALNASANDVFIDGDDSERLKA